MLRKNACFLLLPVFCLLLAACTGPQTGRVRGEGNVSYEDPHAVETLTVAFGSTDLQNAAESMTQSLLASPLLSGAVERPIVRLRSVDNYTDEHIDTKAITDKIRIRLLQSGQVRFLADYANMGEVEGEREHTETKTERGAPDPHLATDYIITGAVRSIAKATKEMQDRYYLVTLELVDPHRGEVVWADETEIRKVGTKPSFGW